MKKSFFVALILAFVPALLPARGAGQGDWWYTLMRGQAMFDRGDYGNALLAFEDARRARRAAYDAMERDLVDVLSMPAVRTLGDSLDWVERFVRERHFSAAAAALDELYFRFPGERFGNSATAALEALGTLRHFPEAEAWIGRTFLAGGETGLALRQFQLALSQGHLMENPAAASDLLYEIAEVRRLRQEHLEMERALLSVLEESALWAGAGTGWQAGPFARDAMTRSLELNGAERLIALFRYGNARTLRAHRELGFFYAASGRHNRAQEHLMFAFVIQNTIVIDELLRRDFDFEFTTLDALADVIAGDRFLRNYAEDNDYYRVAFYLANSLFGNGNPVRARELWTFVAGREGSGEWGFRAAAQLLSPQIVAPVLVMP